jgi:hypothetical protein
VQQRGPSSGLDLDIGVFQKLNNGNCHTQGNVIANANYEFVKCGD